MPVVLGIIFAAVIDPAVCTFEKLWAGCSKTVKRQWGAFSFHNPCISADSCGVLGGGVDSHSPPYRQRRPFAGSIDGYYRDLRLRYDSSQEASWLITWLDKLLDYASDKLPDLFGRTFSATADFLKSAANVLLGLVLSVYFLAGKSIYLILSAAGQGRQCPPKASGKQHG